MSEDVRPTTSETPADPTANLPNDPAILRQMIVELLGALRDTRRQNEELQHRLDLLLRRIYGPRTERFDPNRVQPVWLQLSRERKSLKWCEKAPAPWIGPCPAACSTGQYSLTGAEM